MIKDLGPITPILGVCLGHQGIIDAFGGKVTNAGCVRHGKTSPVQHIDSELFKKNLPNNYDFYNSSDELLDRVNNLLKSNSEIKVENYNYLHKNFTKFLRNI